MHTLIWPWFLSNNTGNYADTAECVRDLSWERLGGSSLVISFFSDRLSSFLHAQYESMNEMARITAGTRRCPPDNKA